MKRWVLISVLLFPIASCSTPAVSSLPSPAVAETPLPVPVSPSVRRFQIKLTLSAPEDLKVKEGDTVTAGQILADRVRDRTRLEWQQREVQRRIEQIIALQTQPVPEIAGLPPAAFLTEVADVERSKLKVSEAERNLQQQQRKLDLLQSMPSADLPEATIPHEQELLNDRQRQWQQAQADLELARATVGQAQQERQHDEYLHSLELSKRAIALRQQELQQQGQLAELEAQRSQLQVQLSTLSAVRSPYSGSIQRLKIIGQTDQTLTVELILVVAESSGASPTAHSRPASRQSASPGRN
ncbi:hypothetical protein ACN4EK_05575 [Pantanalinema rosaneae CENA516]|uniref:hypothetical protein n=1 Tax=Pantanalinema rosaneae TaxID=1620701 RepID=UPI003D70051A